MTSDKIMTEARDVAANEFEPPRIKAIAAELIRLHDGAAWSSEPPSEPCDAWWRKTMSDKPRTRHVGVWPGDKSLVVGTDFNEERILFGGVATVAQIGGFWLRCEPADAALVAELRRELAEARQVAADRAEGDPRVRDQLLEWFGTTDPELLASIFKDRQDKFAEFRRDNGRLRASWELAADTKIIDAKPNELLIETRSGDRRRISMANPEEFDRLQAELAELKNAASVPEQWTRDMPGYRTADELAMTLRGRDKAILLMSAGMMSTCDDRDRLKQESRKLTDELADCQRRLADAERAFDRRLAEVTAERDAVDAALAESVRNCGGCDGEGDIGIGPSREEAEHEPCPRCTPHRELLQRIGVKV